MNPQPDIPEAAGQAARRRESQLFPRPRRGDLRRLVVEFAGNLRFVGQRFLYVHLEAHVVGWRNRSRGAAIIVEAGKALEGADIDVADGNRLQGHMVVGGHAVTLRRVGGACAQGERDKHGDDLLHVVAPGKWAHGRDQHPAGRGR
jgi:hypothetical protein